MVTIDTAVGNGWTNEDSGESSDSLLLVNDGASLHVNTSQLSYTLTQTLVTDGYKTEVTSHTETAESEDDLERLVQGVLESFETEYELTPIIAIEQPETSVVDFHCLVGSVDSVPDEYDSTTTWLREQLAPSLRRIYGTAVLPDDVAGAQPEMGADVDDVYETITVDVYPRQTEHVATDVR